MKRKLIPVKLACLKLGIAVAFFATSFAGAQTTETFPIEKTFSRIQESTGYNFFYKVKDLNTTLPEVEVDTSRNIGEILKELESKTGLHFQIVGKQIIVTDTHPVTGKVVDDKGNAVANAKIYNRTKQITVYSDSQGHYSVDADEGDEVEISKSGFETHKHAVTSGERIETTLRFCAACKEMEKEIEGVVISGYQRLDAKKIAGSYTSINMKNFERRGTPDILSGMEGLSSALVLSANPNDPTGSKELTIRGVSTLAGNTKPLIVVDGFQYEGDIKSINPYEVESINLLKDAAAASIYGARASNGVIIVTTRKGKSGRTQVRYTSNLTFSNKANIEYVMNRVSSENLVNIQEAYAKESIAQDNIINYQNMMETGYQYASSYAMANNPVYYLYSQWQYNQITKAQLDSELNRLRSQDNTNDLKKLYLQTPLLNQQNISVLGGNENFRYRSSLNYTDEYGTMKNSDNKRILFDFVSDIKFSPKFSLEFQSNLNLNNNSTTPIYFDTDGNNTFTRLYDISSYERFFDSQGNALPVTMPNFSASTNSSGLYGGKDPYEIQRLIRAGLLDEGYFPATDFGKYSYSDKNWSTRLQGMLAYKILPWLTAKMGGQLQKGSGITRRIADANSWYMYHLINNTTPISYTGDRATLNIPFGARLQENRSDTNIYLYRTQLNINKDFTNHSISAILGTEIQSIKSTSTSTDRLGYDKASNIYLPTDYYKLGQNISDVYHPFESIGGGIQFAEGFTETENRFFSVYSSLNYSYLDRYILTASARMDQSNLFGTDPKYRYKPFWSVGAKWRVGEENFLKDRHVMLNLRASYGFNGNIANQYGPFDIASKQYIWRAENQLGLNIRSYRIPNLRWEQTGTVNLGLDTHLFNKKFDLVLDYYRKNTTDILSEIEGDPTNGSPFIVRNDASIINNGYEVSLTSHNFKRNGFIWDTQFNFRFNHGKVTDVFFNMNNYSAYFFAGKVLNMKNNEPNSIYVFDYAGVSKDGYGQIRKSNGTIVEVKENSDANDLLVQGDLKAAGPTLPRYVAALNNNFTFKNFSLSFLFVYQGGHKLMKDGYNGNFFGRYIASVNNDAAYAWQKPGDENSTQIPKLSSATYPGIIGGSTKNVIDGDFIRLRDVVLSYTLPHNFSETFKMKEMTINLRGGNLWLWTKNKEGIDPETQGLRYRTFPIQKSFTFGVNLIF